MGLPGAHVSIQGGLSEAIVRGEALGCEAIQIFTRNQRQWNPPPLKEEQAEAFRKRFTESAIQSAVSHGSYLMNLASPDPGQLEKSFAALLDEIDRADQLGISDFVFHPGSHKGAGEAAGLDNLSKSLNRAIHATESSSVRLLIENTAGSANMLGGRFEQLQEVIARVNRPDRMGICIDTAHAFAAGYDLSTPDGIRQTFQEMDAVLGLDHVRVFHVNDSKADLGSRRDRHEHLGKGRLGLPVFRYLVRTNDFANCPLILETPGDEADYERNLEILKHLGNP
jgi:deoxyribonuclease-4